MKACYAMVLETPGGPLHWRERAMPQPAAGQILVEVSACGVCRTDLHLLDIELPEIRYPIVPGHQIVGRVVALGEGVTVHAPGQRVGIPWLGYSCGCCDYCREQRENLCDGARFTGYQIDGGYATHCLADARFAFALPAQYSDIQAAPLLCGGLIGYRSLGMCGTAARVGFYGFGSAAHVLCQVAVSEGRTVYAFTRPDDSKGQAFARRCGAAWAGGSDQASPQPLDAAIIFAPAGELVPRALAATRKGGVVVCGGIHMSDIPSFPYALLWQERSLRSVANLTRQDAVAFLDIAAKVKLEAQITFYPVAQANQALEDLRRGLIAGSAVLSVSATN